MCTILPHAILAELDVDFTLWHLESHEVSDGIGKWSKMLCLVFAKRDRDDGLDRWRIAFEELNDRLFLTQDTHEMVNVLETWGDVLLKLLKGDIFLRGSDDVSNCVEL